MRRKINQEEGRTLLNLPTWVELRLTGIPTCSFAWTRSPTLSAATGRQLASSSVSCLFLFFPPHIHCHLVVESCDNYSKICVLCAVCKQLSIYLRQSTKFRHLMVIYIQVHTFNIYFLKLSFAAASLLLFCRCWSF